MADASSLQLTDRDRRILRFCAEHRFVLAPHVALLLGSGRDGAGRRLGTLHRAGYLGRTSIYRGEPPAYAVTRRGLGASGVRLGAPRRLDPARYAHEVGVAWLGAAAYRGAFGAGADVVTERRMRSEDLRREPGAPIHGLSRAGTGGPGRHYPDLTVVTAPGRRIAFELELHVKSRARRERILAAYACDPGHDAVVYLVATEADRETLRRSARRVGLDDRLHVKRFTWPGGRAPGTSAERAAGRRTPAREALR